MLHVSMEGFASDAPQTGVSVLGAWHVSVGGQY